MNKKTLFVAFALLTFIAVIVWAKSDNNVSFNLGKAASKWKGIRINEEDLPNAVPTRARVYQIFFAGTGIAVDPNDKLDFKYIRIIGGRVLVPQRNVSEESSNSSDLEVKCANTTAGRERCFTFVRAGLLYLDKDRYTLRNIDFDNDSATASIYQNSTEVGSIALVKVMKMGRRMWVGTLTVGNTNYFAYILGADHPLLIGNTADEKAQERSDEGKKCGPKLPVVNASAIAECKQNGGRIYIGRDDNGCPMAPTCVSANCTAVTPLSAQERAVCRSKGGAVVAGVDEDGCPAAPKCVLASGETG
jgi:hypothetical protein